MNLSSLEESGVKVPKMIPPNSTNAEIKEIKKDISDIKDMLVVILEKLSK